MHHDIQFTAREQYILSYFRDVRSSGRWRRLSVDGSVIGLSILFLALGFNQGDVVYGVVAYAVLLWRNCAWLWQAGNYTEDYRNIFAKYDAKIEELAKINAQSSDSAQS